MAANEETPRDAAKFDFSAYPPDTLFHERRENRDRRAVEAPPPVLVPAVVPEKRARKERRRRIDPTTFEKQYTDDEIEFMNAMQRFKVQSGKSFPTYGEVLRVAFGLGYRRVIRDDLPFDDDEPAEVPELDALGVL